MLKYIWSLLFGKCKIACKKTYAEEISAFAENNRGMFDSISCTGDFYIIIFPEKYAYCVTKYAEEHFADYTFERLPGIPKLYYRYKHRPGILAGAFLFFAVILLSQRIIWDFDITGNERTPDSEIIAALEAVGCSSGTLISDLDFGLIQNNCLMGENELSWISVNMDGNLARVEVREKRIVPIKYKPTEGMFANIIAAEDGVIELCRVKNGKAVVYPGNTVRKGELLITGVIDIGETGVRYEYAEGEVMATVYREIESFVPFSMQNQELTGEKKTEYQLKFFGKSIKLSPKGSIDYNLYGKIIENEKLSLPFGITLPIWMTKTVYSEMREETVSVTEEEAMRLAEKDAAAKLTEMADTLQVLSVSKDYETNDDGVRVTLGVYGVTDISANYGFTVSESGTESITDK